MTLRCWLLKFDTDVFSKCSIYTTGYVPLSNGWFGWFMVFNATFNNVSVIPWQSVFLVEETGVPIENHRPVASY